MNMNILAAVTLLSIYHVRSTLGTFWEKNFTSREFTPVNMKNCGRRNVRKHKDIKKYP